MNAPIHTTSQTALPANAHTPTEQALPLADIHLPNAVSAWPPAIGWWLVAVLIIMMLIGVFYGYKYYQKKYGYRRAALNLLRQHHQAYQAKQTSSFDTAISMMTILKRTAITAYKVEHAALFGQAWIDFLNQQSKESHFTDALANWMVTLQYQNTNNQHKNNQESEDKSNIDINELYRACQLWIKQHPGQSKPNSKASSSANMDEILIENVNTINTNTINTNTTNSNKKIEQKSLGETT